MVAVAGLLMRGTLSDEGRDLSFRNAAGLRRVTLDNHDHGQRSFIGLSRGRNKTVHVSQFNLLGTSPWLFA
jgi:hypothetical protein